MSTKVIAFCDGETLEATKDHKHLEDAFKRTNKGKYVSIEYKRYYKNRSNSQNAAQWSGLLNHIVKFHEHHGDLISIDDANDWLRRECFPRVEYQSLGVTRLRTPSSTELNTVEWSDVLKKANHKFIHNYFYEFIPEKQY